MEIDQKFVRFILIQMVLAASITILITSGMKLIFDVPRPCEGLVECPDSASFPSRHTAGAFSIATVFMFYTRHIFYKTLAFIAASLVGYYRYAVGLHYSIDIFVGAAVGIAIGFGIYYLVRSRKKYKNYFR